jgi:hypothetical protein
MRLFILFKKNLTQNFDGFDGFDGFHGLSDFVSSCQQDLELQEAQADVGFCTLECVFSVLQSH